MNDGLNLYGIKDGTYIYRDSLLVRINQELQKVQKSKDREEFKRGYRQALQMVENWALSGPRVMDDG